MNQHNNTMHETNITSTGLFTGAFSSLVGFFLALISGEPSVYGFLQNLGVGLIVMIATWIFKPIFDAWFQPHLARLKKWFKRNKNKE